MLKAALGRSSFVESKAGRTVIHRLDAQTRSTPGNLARAAMVGRWMSRPTQSETHGAERGLNRFEGFSDAVFAIALTLLIVEIKVPGSPEGPHGYSDLAAAMAEQWREHLALVLCYVVIGAYWLQ